MGYVLHAVIADGALLRGAAREVAAARLAPLGQGLSLMPMTDTLFDAVTDGGPARQPGFRRLPGGFDALLATWSAAGPVAYVEAEYFGGVGEQLAGVWDGGTLVLGPLRVGEGQGLPAAGSPISQVLRRLGAVAGADEDEFTAVGLGRHRDPEAWIG
ncbi:hypothetical protein [Streptomyces alboflavus]|uniref:hypothetical protein n=1 Tax=Streptomyces alboflavus TaxID=67267 RepID=UPI0004C0828F|nr:hypothetical protein [Streptomyces alboflavus]